MKSLKLYKQDKHKIVEDGFPYYKCNQCDFEITAMKSLKLYKQDKHKIVSNINVTSVVMKPQFLRTNEWATNVGIIYVSMYRVWL